MGEHDSDDGASGSHTRPTEAIDQGSTVELDRYSIMQQVQKDLRMTNTPTLRIPVQKPPDDEDSRATQQLPAVSERTTLKSADPDLLEALKVPEMSMQTMDIVLEPISAISGAITSPLTARMEFETVIQPGGLIRIPDVFLKSGHAKAGLRIRVIAEPA